MRNVGSKHTASSIAWTRIYPQGNGPVNVRGLETLQRGDRYLLSARPYADRDDVSF